MFELTHNNATQETRSNFASLLRSKYYNIYLRKVALLQLTELNSAPRNRSNGITRIDPIIPRQANRNLHRMSLLTSVQRIYTKISMN